jgi:pyruvate/2-oxoacid:ferredoxin oxidoreductase beta subunit
MAAGKLNRIGLEPQIYKGGKTTLCAGCGHNAISERIIDAFYEMGVDPRQVIKLSGIGCSSKSPAYFLGGSHGFNAVHGRMPSVGTGRDAREQEAHRHRRQRRRRHGRDRHRPVRAPDAAATCRSSTSSKTTAATA